MKITDTFTIDGPRKTNEGFLIANVRAVRTGIQQYLGAELGRPDLPVVNVLRPAEEVFHKDALRSFGGLTLTNDHPSEMVNADNWRDYAVGETGWEILNDGGFMRIPIMLRDAETIKAVESGKNQLSAGYEADIEWVDGVTEDGLTYQAVQRNIRGNHLSIVGAARGGSKLKIGDNRTMKTMLVDGFSVEVTDQSEAALNKVVRERDEAKTAIATKDAEITRLTGELSAKTGEIAVINKKLEDSVLTPEALESAVAARSALIDSAKSIVSDYDAKGKTDAEIRREIVTAKLGDAAKNFDDGAFAGAFATLAASVTKQTSQRDSLGNIPLSGGGNGQVVNFADAKKQEEDAWAAMVSGYEKKA